MAEYRPMLDERTLNMVGWLSILSVIVAIPGPGTLIEVASVVFMMLDADITWCIWFTVGLVAFSYTTTPFEKAETIGSIARCAAIYALQPLGCHHQYKTTL